MERAEQMYGQYIIEIVDRYGVEFGQPIDAGVRYHNIDATVFIKCPFYQSSGGFRLGDIVPICQRLAAEVSNFLDNLSGRVLGRMIAAARDTNIVDDDAGTAPGKFQGVGTPQPPTSSGDDGDAVLQANFQDRLLNMSDIFFVRLEDVFQKPRPEIFVDAIEDR